MLNNVITTPFTSCFKQPGSANAATGSFLQRPRRPPACLVFLQVGLRFIQGLFRGYLMGKSTINGKSPCWFMLLQGLFQQRVLGFRLEKQTRQKRSREAQKEKQKSGEAEAKKPETDTPKRKHHNSKNNPLATTKYC